MKIYTERLNIVVTDDIIKMLENYQNYIFQETNLKISKSETIRTMIFQRWAQIPEKYKSNL